MSEILEKETTKQKIEPPKMWSVIFLNDDFTTFEFVMECLIGIFNKSPQEAYQITKQVHDNNKAVVGTYMKDIAVTKQEKTINLAREFGHPLRVEIEKE